MSDHRTSPLRPEADDLLQVSPQNRFPPPPALPDLIHRQLTRSHRDRQRSPIPSPSLPTSLASLPHHHKPIPQNHRPPPLVPSSSSPTYKLRHLPPPSRQQNKRPGRPRTQRKSPSGVDKTRKDVSAPRRKGRGGRSVGRVNARSRPSPPLPRDRGETSRRERIPAVRVRARASGRQCRGGA
jgi:hypothetical protein